MPRPVNASAFVFSNTGLNSSLCCWGAVSLLLSQQPDVCWGSCLVESCCSRGAGETWFSLGGSHCRSTLLLAGRLWPLKAFEPTTGVISGASPEGTARVYREMVFSTAASQAPWCGNGGRFKDILLCAAEAALTLRDYGEGVIPLAEGLLGRRHEQKAWFWLLVKYSCGAMGKTRSITPQHCSRMERTRITFSSEVHLPCKAGQATCC